MGVGSLSVLLGDNLGAFNSNFIVEDSLDWDYNGDISHFN